MEVRRRAPTRRGSVASGSRWCSTRSRARKRGFSSTSSVGGAGKQRARPARERGEELVGGDRQRRTRRRSPRRTRRCGGAAGLEAAHGRRVQPAAPQLVRVARAPGDHDEHLLDAGELDQHAAQVEQDRVDGSARRPCQRSASVRPSGTNTIDSTLPISTIDATLRRLLAELLGDHEVEHRRRQAAEQDQQARAAWRRGRAAGASSAAIAMPGQRAHERRRSTPRRQSPQRTSSSRTPSEISISGISASPTMLDRDRQPVGHRRMRRARTRSRRTSRSPSDCAAACRSARGGRSIHTPRVKCSRLEIVNSATIAEKPGCAEGERRERQAHVAAVVEHHRRHERARSPRAAAARTATRAGPSPARRRRCRASARRWRRRRSPCSPAREKISAGASTFMLSRLTHRHVGLDAPRVEVAQQR